MKKQGLSVRKIAKALDEEGLEYGKTAISEWVRDYPVVRYPLENGRDGQLLNRGHCVQDRGLPLEDVRVDPELNPLPQEQVVSKLDSGDLDDLNDGIDGCAEICERRDDATAHIGIPESEEDAGEDDDYMREPEDYDWN